MQIRKKKTRNTSLTIKALDQHIKKALVSHELACTMNTGLHAVKRIRKNRKTGAETAYATYRLRYRVPTPTGIKVRVKTIGEYHPGSNDISMQPSDAADIAQSYYKIEDPLLHEQEQMDKAMEDASNTVDSYLEGKYASYQAKNTNEGTHNIGIIRAGFPHLLNTPLCEITPYDISEWYAMKSQSGPKIKQGKETTEPFKYSTLERQFNALKSMLNQAVKDQTIEDNPIRDVALDPQPYDDVSVETESPSRRALTAGEEKSLFIAVKEFESQAQENLENGNKLSPVWFVPFFMVAFFTGMRPGDIRHLKWQQVNWKLNSILLVPHKTHKAKKKILLHVPLHETLYKVLKGWYKACGSPKDGYVFTSPITGRAFSGKVHRNHWNTVRKAAGVEDLHFYSLRHHFCSKLVHLNVPLLEVAKMAGHTDMRMIDKWYGHINLERSSEAIKRFGQDLSFS